MSAVLSTSIETLRLAVGVGSHLSADRSPGRRPALVWLHGLTSNRQGEKSAALFARAAALGREAWRFDFRGHGESGNSLRETTLTDLIADTEAVLTESGPAYLVGSSLGGLVAAWTAVRHPELVLGLVLLAPALRFLSRMQDHMDDRGRLMIDHTAGELEFAPEVLFDFLSYDEAELGPGIRQPVLCVHGALDETVPVAASEELIGSIAHSNRRLFILPEGDHRLNREIASILDAAETFHGW